MIPTEELRWYTPRQAAPMLGIDLRDVRTLCETDQITHRRMQASDGRFFYKISNRAVEEYISRITRRAS